MDKIKDMLTSRLTQLIVRVIGGLLVAKLGYDSAQVQTTAATIAAGCALAVAVGFDLVVHEVRKKLNV